MNAMTPPILHSLWQGTARAFAIAACVALAGCASDVPYQPSRAIVSSIPPERARAELKRLLGVGYFMLEISSARMENIEVGETAFSFPATFGTFGQRLKKCRFPYAILHPRATYESGLPSVFLVRLTEFNDPEHIRFDEKEDVETFLDVLESLKAHALDSLKADALARAGRAPAVSPAPSAPVVVAPADLVCPKCGTHYPAGTRFCKDDGTALAN